MEPPPARLDGATVLRYVIIGDVHRPTGVCVHHVGGQVKGPASALAICRHQEEESFLLFYCDAEWNVVTDTHHDSLDVALGQAESEYEGVSGDWQTVAPQSGSDAGSEGAS